MTIRAAFNSDVMALIGLIEACYEQSIYAQFGKVRRDRAQKFLMNMLQIHGAKGANSSLVWMAETHGIASGLIIAVKQPVYFVGDVLAAQEVIFYGRAGVVEPKDMVALFRRYLSWAEEDERVVEIKASSRAIFPGQDIKDLRPFYERRGMALDGEIFVRRIQR